MKLVTCSVRPFLAELILETFVLAVRLTNACKSPSDPVTVTVDTIQFTIVFILDISAKSDMACKCVNIITLSFLFHSALLSQIQKTASRLSIS